MARSRNIFSRLFAKLKRLRRRGRDRLYDYLDDEERHARPLPPLPDETYEDDPPEMPEEAVDEDDEDTATPEMPTEPAPFYEDEEQEEDAFTRAIRERSKNLRPTPPKTPPRTIAGLPSSAVSRILSRRAAVEGSDDESGFGIFTRKRRKRKLSSAQMKARMAYVRSFKRK